jgi:hypothetical protein
VAGSEAGRLGGSQPSLFSSLQFLNALTAEPRSVPTLAWNAAEAGHRGRTARLAHPKKSELGFPDWENKK